ncbi:MAG: GNAT family N-acetyltransferase [Butyrivibrio sp.]|nr:GNAT family N-acetyltransferase [Butyrivibrio sp.]
MDNNVIRTKRMILYPLTENEMEAVISRETDKEMKQAYSEMLAGCIAKPEQRIWYAIWNMQLNDGSDIIIGDYAFKGLDENGMIEIGYGIKEQYESKGYMTEAVTAAVEWARMQPGVKKVEAETDPDNKASQRVLQKAGFIPNGVMGKEGPRFYYAQE